MTSSINVMAEKTVLCLILYGVTADRAEHIKDMVYKKCLYQEVTAKLA
ncbi:MAG: hypothetical protein K2H47_10740 [Muribaculaceae bacterium]|nr:hypothetical protein [Muribaculaceae bacterium]